MMGETAAHLTVNGTKRQSHGHFPRPDDRKALPQQFWAGFWTESIQALNRHIQYALTISIGHEHNVDRAVDVSRGVLINDHGSAIRAGRCRCPLGAIDG